MQDNKELVSLEKEIKESALVYLKNQNNLNENEMREFILLCCQYKLNPLKREIYAVKYGNKSLQVITNYYEYLKRADATGLLEYYNVEIEENNSVPTIGWFIAKRKDQSKELRMKFVFKEWNQAQSLWLSKPFFMFDKCIIANGMRRLFPNELGNMPYVNEELWYWNKDNEEIIKEHIKQEQEQPNIELVNEVINNDKE